MWSFGTVVCLFLVQCLICIGTEAGDNSGDNAGNDDGDDSGGNGIFTCIISGIVGGGVVVIVIGGGMSLLLIFLVKKMTSTKQGVVLSCCGIWCTMRCGRGHATESQGQKLEQLEEAIYDEPLETGIDIGDNQAYGHMNDNKENL